MITLQEILNLKTDLFKTSRVKLVRHKDRRAEYRDLIKDREELLKYQQEQGKPIFHDCDYIISFIGQEQRKSILFGVFKVMGFTFDDQVRKYYYNLEQLTEFEYLANRVIIDWGNNAISWHQWYDKQIKEIIQILPQGYMGSFPGLLNFVLDFSELKILINNPDANQDWKSNLSSIDGIYLILDSKTGNQYIGSASGKEGIWQRWTDYATTVHGGNEKLKELVSEDPNCYKHFKYSILQSLPSNLTQKEVVAIENLYKEKLGTKGHGLNIL